MNEEEAYIRAYARQIGLPEDQAVAVARSEGGLTNPFQHGRGPAPRSQDPSFGKYENAFGPFQLYISGNNAGMGDRALAAGVDPRKDWQAGVRYAEDTAKREGWGEWYGARKIGLAGPNAAAGNAFALSKQGGGDATNAPASGTPGPQPGAPPPGMANSQQLMKMLMVQSALAGFHLQPVDYDPYKVMPHFDGGSGIEIPALPT